MMQMIKIIKYTKMVSMSGEKDQLVLFIDKEILFFSD